MHEFFDNRNPDSEEVIQSQNNQFIATFPITPDGCYFVGGGLANNEAKNYIFDNTTKTLMMISEVYMLMNAPCKNFKYVVSLKGTNFWHILQPSISSVRKSLNFLENAVPINVEAFYVLDALPIVKYMIGE